MPPPPSPTRQRPLKVAVIGCGPGGMFLAHAVERKRRDLQQQLQHCSSSAPEQQAIQLQEELNRLPEVTLFETTGEPGGVWKSKKQKPTGSSNHGSRNNNVNNNRTTTTNRQHAATNESNSDNATMEKETKTAEETDLLLPSYTDTTCANDDPDTTTNTNMYEALWCNGPKEVMEFPDYTFVDHFGEVSLPVYLPRQAVLEYILGRVTRDCPDFFANYAQFHTHVDRVTYDPNTQQFSVTLTQSVNHHTLAMTTRQLFDRVVWSAGQNGRAKIPPSIQEIIDQAHQEYLVEQQQQQQYATPLPPPPPFWHSSAVDQRLQQLLSQGTGGAHVAIVGGAYSAEDLALMVIQWGAARVTMIHRRHGVDVPIGWTRHWPNHNHDNNHCAVDVCLGYELHRAQVEVVSEDAATTTTTYTLHLTSNNNDKDDDREDSDSESDSTDSNDDDSSSTTSIAKTIHGVHVLLCCTGYSEHLDMLDRSCYNMTDQEYDTYWNEKDRFDLPKDWTMADNCLSSSGILEPYASDKKKYKTNGTRQNHIVNGTTNAKSLHIAPRRKTLYPGCYVNPYSYRECLFVHNTNLMWLAANNFETPLLALDVQAQLCFQWIAGYQPIPSREDMKTSNYQQAVHEMTHLPMLRYWMDTNYYHVVRRWLADTTKSHRIPIDGSQYNDENHHDHDADDNNYRTYYEYPQEWLACYKQTAEYEMRLLARLMHEADYPIQLGTFDELNELGREYVRTSWDSRNEKATGRQTFRDVTAEHASTIKSLLTGTPAVPLRGLWMDVAEEQLDRVLDLV